MKPIETLKIPPYSDKEQEEYIQQSIAELTAYVELQGEQDAHHDQPVNEAQLRAFVYNRIQVHIQSLIEDNQKRHLLTSGIAVAKKILADAKQKIAKLDAAIFDDRHKLPRLKRIGKETTSNVTKTNDSKWVKYARWVISATEGCYVFEVLRHSKIPAYTALFISASIAVAIGMSTHALAGWVKKAKSDGQMILRYCGVLIPAFIGFAVIGQMRADIYNQAVDLSAYTRQGTVPHTSPVSGWLFTSISFLLYLVVLGFSIKYHRDEEERKQERHFDEVSSERTAIEDGIEEKEQQKIAIDKEATELAARAVSEYEYASITEEHLTTLAKEVFEAYKDKNLRYRTDGLCPQFFSFPPPFQFKFYFLMLKNRNNENNTNANPAYAA